MISWKKWLIYFLAQNPDLKKIGYSFYKHISIVIFQYKVHQYQLDIDSLSIDEMGNYTCIVENSYGKINFTYKLEVLGRYNID
jgi:hypothetical protein